MDGPAARVRDPERVLLLRARRGRHRAADRGLGRVRQTHANKHTAKLEPVIGRRRQEAAKEPTQKEKSQERNTKMRRMETEIQRPEIEEAL